MKTKGEENLVCERQEVEVWRREKEGLNVDTLAEPEGILSQLLPFCQYKHKVFGLKELRGPQRQIHIPTSKEIG
jgi:hypothetical protein